MPLWRRNLNSKQRRRSRKGKQPTAVEFIKLLPGTTINGCTQGTEYSESKDTTVTFTPPPEAK